MASTRTRPGRIRMMPTGIQLLFGSPVGTVSLMLFLWREVVESKVAALEQAMEAESVPTRSFLCRENVANTAQNTDTVDKFPGSEHSVMIVPGCVDEKVNVAYSRPSVTRRARGASTTSAISSTTWGLAT